METRQPLGDRNTRKHVSLWGTGTHGNMSASGGQEQTETCQPLGTGTHGNMSASGGQEHTETCQPLGDRNTWKHSVCVSSSQQ